MAIDHKEPEHFEDWVADFQYWDCDLRDYDAADWALENVKQVYQLAADMGGAGYVFTGDHDYEIMSNNTLINVNVMKAAQKYGIERILFTSSACTYPEFKQDTLDAAPLKEEDAYPAGPDSEYGWEKLYAERMYMAFSKATGIPVRIARFHNIYGPEGSWNDGREKLPAAACRKVAEAKLSGNHVVDVWGDGTATRSFCYIDDCLEMLYRLMQSDHDQPLNIGTDTVYSVNGVHLIAAHIAGIQVEMNHIPGPRGVQARNADLTKMREALDYEPKMGFIGGMEKTYNWIENQVKKEIKNEYLQ